MLLNKEADRILLHSPTHFDLLWGKWNYHTVDVSVSCIMAAETVSMSISHLQIDAPIVLTGLESLTQS